MSRPATRTLVITACADPLMWYRDLIGRTVPLIRDVPEGWLAREPAGYQNIVLRHEGVELLGVIPGVDASLAPRA